MGTCHGEGAPERRPPLPKWIRVRARCGGGRDEVDGLLGELGLHTVCQSANCPNLGECWHQRTATFMILGDVCTRNCRFCAVKHGVPAPPDLDEPGKVAEAAKRLGLKYVVVTSVTRDDLPDGGAGIFAATIQALRGLASDVKVEVLTPDFNLDQAALRTVLEARPDVFNHNLETVERITKQVRYRAEYRKSLEVLRLAGELSGGAIAIKSGIMVGLGETDEEVVEALRDLRAAGVSLLTIGQYLPPSASHWPLARYVEPARFAEWETMAKEMGFTGVASGPLVRSSYMAERLGAGKT